MITKLLKYIKYLFALILVLSLSGCFENISNFNIDPTIMRANPYLKEIKVDDSYLKDYALSIIKDCNTTNHACVVNQIYRHIVENYQYISDPEDEEVIQSPFETIAIHGGDCEDLSILLISLLENIGVESYLVLTDNHAYALAVDIHPNSLWPYVEESLLTQVEQDNNKTIRQQFSKNLKVDSGWYYGGDGGDLNESYESLTFTYTITSSRPIDVYIVPSYDEFNASLNQSSFQHYSNCVYKGITQVTDNCTIQQYGGIGLRNQRFRPASVSVDVELYFKPSFYSLFKNDTISSYILNGKQSVVLDPTAGAYGYPGYNANVTGEKIAFDPISKEYVYLS